MAGVPAGFGVLSQRVHHCHGRYLRYAGVFRQLCYQWFIAGRGRCYFDRNLALTRCFSRVSAAFEEAAGYGKIGDFGMFCVYLGQYREAIPTNYMLEIQKDQSTELLEKAVDSLKKSGFENIQSALEGAESPKAYYQTTKEAHIAPDIMAEKNGKIYLFEIALRTDDVRQVKGRWMFFKTLAGMKNYSFQVFMPKGSVSFARSVISSMDEKINTIKI